MSKAAILHLEAYDSPAIAAQDVATRTRRSVELAGDGKVWDVDRGEFISEGDHDDAGLPWMHLPAAINVASYGGSAAAAEALASALCLSVGYLTVCDDGTAKICGRKMTRSDLAGLGLEIAGHRDLIAAETLKNWGEALKMMAD